MVFFDFEKIPVKGTIMSRPIGELINYGVRREIQGQEIKKSGFCNSNFNWSILIFFI
jgi:hypothetical protein